MMHCVVVLLLADVTYMSVFYSVRRIIFNKVHQIHILFLSIFHDMLRWMYSFFFFFHVKEHVCNC